MFPLHTYSALKQSSSRLACSVHSRRVPALSQSFLSNPQLHLRRFSATSRAQVQYIRFSNGQNHHRGTPTYKPTLKIVGFVGAAGAVYYVAHLEKVPETGRTRYMDISPKFEAELARTSYATLLSQFEGKILPANHPITRHVRRVATDLLEASDLGTIHSSEPRRSSMGSDDLWSGDPFTAAMPRDLEPTMEGDRRQWNLLVVNDPKIVNALASFGNIVVFTGILPVCKNEQGLAAVLSHEIAHAVARHAAERYSSSKWFIVTASLLQLIGFDIIFLNLLNTFLFDLPNSRNQELEADAIGMRIASKACYDPRSAIEFHTRLAMASKSEGAPEFFRTHPAPEHRLERLEELIPEGDGIRASNPRCVGMHDKIEQFFVGMGRQ